MNNLDPMQFANDSMDRYLDVCDRGRLNERFAEISGTIGYDPEITEKYFNPDSYEFQEPAGGLVDFSNLSTEKIPVVVADSAREFRFRARQHPLQIGTVALGVAQELTVGPSEGSDVASVGAVREVNARNGTVTISKYHPIMVLHATKGTEKIGRTCPSVIAHEMMHVVQTLGRPVERYAAHGAKKAIDYCWLDDELEGYSIQASMADELFLDPEPVMSIDMAITVNAVRRKVLGRNGHNSNRDFVRAAMADIFVRRIVPPGLVNAGERSRF